MKAHFLRVGLFAVAVAVPQARAAAGTWTQLSSSGPVSYTHLTLPTN